jgi:hypothetical protein
MNISIDHSAVFAPEPSALKGIKKTRNARSGKITISSFGFLFLITNASV